MVITPSGAAPALTRGRGKGGKVGRPKTKHARWGGRQKAKPFRKGNNNGEARKWIQVPRPPGPQAKFSVPTWVPIDTLTLEERKKHIVEPEPIDAGTADANAPGSALLSIQPSVGTTPKPSGGIVEENDSNPPVVDHVNANGNHGVSNLLTALQGQQDNYQHLGLPVQPELASHMAIS